MDRVPLITAPALVLMAAIGLMPGAAEAACKQWDLSGDWRFIQANGYNTGLHLQQSDSVILGDAGYWYQAGGEPYLGIFPRGTDPAFVGGSVDGTIDGATFEITTYWESASIGVYAGTINPRGRLQGISFDKLHPKNIASWYSDRVARCADVATAPQPSVGMKPAPRPGTVLTSPDVAAVSPNITGTWAVSSDKPWGYRMEFNQNGTSVSGTYVVDVNGVAGRIKGTLKGNVLNFRWDQDGGYTGDGNLRLAADGKSFDGSYRVDDNGTLTPDLLKGEWHGTMTSGVAPATGDEGSVDYGGCAGCSSEPPDPLH